ncbi:DUF6531 domain-containing protein, partial [Pseudomonas aeruginosa]|uniref:DUF6531 domain-containing protein n=1 Tax=Pseudomonas aeruginosa TaxID=287 RepID=UPI0032E3A5E8
MNRRLAFHLILFTTSLSTASPAVSESSFYWESGLHIGADGKSYRFKGSSPFEVCRKIVSTGWRWNYFYSGLKKVSDTKYDCTSFRSSDKYTAATSIYLYGNNCSTGERYQILNPYSPTCLPPEEKGPPSQCPIPSSYVGNPINFSTGNKFQQEISYHPKNDSSLSFSYTYNSLDGLWRHNYSTHLQFSQDKNSAALILWNGKEYHFIKNNEKLFTTPTPNGNLSKTTTGWKYTSQQNDVYIFDETGRLISQAKRNGPTQKISYNGNSIIITDQAQNSATLTTDPDQQPLTFRLPELSITLTYVGQKLVATNRTFYGNTTQRRYYYEDRNNDALLTGISDENGIRYATWTYDDQGRAISSEHANGAEKVTLAYNDDGSTTVTNEYGKQATYRFQVIQGIKRIVAIEGEPS